MTKCMTLTYTCIELSKKIGKIIHYLNSQHFGILRNQLAKCCVSHNFLRLFVTIVVRRDCVGAYLYYLHTTLRAIHYGSIAGN